MHSYMQNLQMKGKGQKNHFEFDFSMQGFELWISEQLVKTPTKIYHPILGLLIVIDEKCIILTLKKTLKHFQIWKI